MQDTTRDWCSKNGVNGEKAITTPRRSSSRLRFGLVGLALSLAGLVARADIEITLKNSFIEKFKERATIETNYIVDKAHKKPNAPSKDGDLHVAGRAGEVQLPVVAEIMNAVSQDEAVDAMHAVEGTNKRIHVDGAWRLWCEHGGNDEQIQGAPLEPFTTTNPDHVFEIHPVTRVGERSILESLKPIEGFKTKDAEQAFVTYENVKCEIKKRSKTTTIVTRMAGFNYVEFVMELTADVQKLADGHKVFASVRDLEGELLVRKRRMIFVKDSPPDKALEGKKKGDRLHVLGIPRINLSLVSWRVAHAGEKPEVLKWSLPYEMIIAAVYPGEAGEDDGE